jgi:hypothetical protein
VTFIVVKYAADGYWKKRWLQDPKRIGVVESDTAAFSRSGKEAALKTKYLCSAEAGAAAARINQINPCGGYAVCPQIKAIKYV